MENIINKISNDLLVYIQESGMPLQMPEFSINSQENHEPLFKKYIIGSGLFNGNFNDSDPMIFDLITISKENSFLVFCNTTSKKSKEFNSVFIHGTKELTDIQRLIINYCYNSFKEKVNTIVIMYDKGNFPIELTFEQYIEIINQENKKEETVEKLLLRK